MRAALAAILLAGTAGACLSPPDEAMGTDDADAAGGCSVDLDFDSQGDLDDWEHNSFDDCTCGAEAGELFVDNTGGGDRCLCFFVSPELELEDTIATVRLSTPGDGLAVSFTFDLRGTARRIYFSRARDTLYFGECLSKEPCSNSAYGQVTFSPEAMELWRFHHDASNERVTFLTSPDGDDWEERAFAPVTPASLEGAGLALGAFDAGSAPAERIGLDDLSLCDAPP